MNLDDIVTDILGRAGPVLDSITWAEQEISAAQARHPAVAGQIWNSFSLLRPTSPLMGTQPVYQAHCQELLNRVAHRHDTRPGTATECCIALSQISLRVPLNTTAAGLYARMWLQAGLPPSDLSNNGIHYEALDGASIDDQEKLLRHRLRQPWRTLAPSTESTAT